MSLTEDLIQVKQLDKDKQKKILKESIEFLQDDFDSKTKDELELFVSLLHVVSPEALKEIMDNEGKELMLNERLLNINSYLDLLIEVYGIDYGGE